MIRDSILPVSLSKKRVISHFRQFMATEWKINPFSKIRHLKSVARGACAHKTSVGIPLYEIIFPVRLILTKVRYLRSSMLVTDIRDEMRW